MLDKDKNISDLLNDLNNLSTQGSQNEKANLMILITALGKHAGILRLLAESSEKSTKRIEFLTWAMLALTVVLVALTIIMIKIM